MKEPRDSRPENTLQRPAGSPEFLHFEQVRVRSPATRQYDHEYEYEYEYEYELFTVSR